MSLGELQKKIEEKSANVAVIGLGYVGLPVACMFAEAGFQTIGVDVDAKRVEKINAGENPIEGIEPGLAELIATVTSQTNLTCTTDYANLKDTDVVLISVQTPVEDDHRPRYAHMRSALEALGAVLKDGALVIIESTLAPGTMTNVIIPTLEQAVNGRTFYIGHCPERVTPGKLIHNLKKMSRVVGGQTLAVAEVMITLYRHIVEGDLDATDILTAELVKTTENAYRDVQIAFANEMARICENLNGDIWRVRELVNKSPGRNMLYPGAGVGGHCIPKDSWLLIANVDDQFTPSLIPAARNVNRAMPQYVVDLTRDGLKAKNVAVNAAVIAVLGYAYMENSDDTRDTPTQYFIDIMESHGATLRIHDPFVKHYQGDLHAVLDGADAIVIMVAHDEYKNKNWLDITNPVLIDARHVLPDDFVKDDIAVRVLGRGKLGEK